MKIRKILAVVALTLPLLTNAQWEEKEGNVYREDGKVGIGVKRPDTYLHIKKNESSGTKTRNFIRLQNINDGALSGVSLDMISGKSANNQVRTFISNAAYSYAENPNFAGFSQFAGFNNGVIIRAADSTEGKISFLIDGSEGPGSNQEAMRINPDMNIGIGTSSPFEKLTVNGNLALNNDLNERFGLSFYRNSNDKLASVSLNKFENLVLKTKGTKPLWT